jgi:alpha-L-fucosidase 2
MLLQSHAGEIDLLPALPSKWPCGHVAGLRARGGFEVDITWDKGVLVKARITPTRDGKCRIRYGNKTIRLGVTPDEKLRFDGDLQRL